MKAAGWKANAAARRPSTSDGKLVKEFRGNSGNGFHQQNFIDAVRRRDPSILNAPVKVGHDSTGWCNLANIAFRAGGSYSAADAASVKDSQGLWEGLLDGHAAAPESLRDRLG